MVVAVEWSLELVVHVGPVVHLHGVDCLHHEGHGRKR